ncbi:unnamed protein product, partial [Meganyctiphanes norvegica]
KSDKPQQVEGAMSESKETTEEEDKQTSDFLGFTPGKSGNSSTSTSTNINTSTSTSKAENIPISRADIAQANAMAKQLHVYKPGIDFVPGARLEVQDVRDGKW